MRLSSSLVPVAGTIIILSAAVPVLPGPHDLPAVLGNRAPDPDLGDFLDDLPALINDIVSTSLSIARALREAVKDDALVRNDLDAVLSGNATGTVPNPDPGETPNPNTDNINENGNNLQARQDEEGGSNQNTTPIAAPCPDIAVLYAKGTKEPGNVGFLTGPPFFAALETYLNGTSDVAVQGISYKASLLSASSSDGSFRMVDLARRTAEVCPGTRITMAGYSRGAVVVRSALEQMDTEGTAGISSISSVVLFGDPREGDPVPVIEAGRVVSFCHEGDIVCRPSGNQETREGRQDNRTEEADDLTNSINDGISSERRMVGEHLNYAMDAPGAAMFVMQRSGLGMASADAMNDGMEGTLAGMVQDIARNGANGIDS